MGILLVYDVTDRETFRSVRNWMSNIQMYASNDVNKVGMKARIHGVCVNISARSKFFLRKLVPDS